MIRYANDGTDNAPALRCYLNLMTLEGLSSLSNGPQGSLTERLAAIRSAGFEGVEFFDGGDAYQCKSHGLGMCRAIRVNKPTDANCLAAKLVDLGHECGTVHVGWGMEDDTEAIRLLEAVLQASDRYQIPLFPEIHRATILQDMYRCVRFVGFFPEMRLNADLVHWYTAQEMVYGGFENKFNFILPVLENVGFIHGRIGDPGCIQVAVDPNNSSTTLYIEHFQLMWSKCFEGFLRQSGPGDYIVFAPELLQANLYYARTIPDDHDGGVEQCDRWEQALLYMRMACDCFAKAKAQFRKRLVNKGTLCN